MKGACWRIVGWGYVLALHLAVVLALFHSEAIWRRVHRLWPPGETVSEFRRGTARMQTMIDLTARPNAVWFFGDSIIHALDTARVTERALNLSIGEDTVSGVLSRIGDHPALATAAGVVLAIGTNDLAFRSPQETAAAYETLLARVPPGMPVIVSAVLPVDERVSPIAFRGRNAAIARLNAALARLCAARDGCFFADAGPALQDATGNLAREHHTGDGLHLNGAGYRVLIETLAPLTREHMPSRG